MTRRYSPEPTRPKSLDAHYQQLEEASTVSATAGMLKTFEDAMITGTGWMKAGDRIDPKDVLLDPPPPIDHKALLVKFMQYLTRTQGTTFLFNAAKASFTEAEFAELRRLLWEES